MFLVNAWGDPCLCGTVRAIPDTGASDSFWSTIMMLGLWLQPDTHQITLLLYTIIPEKCLIVNTVKHNHVSVKNCVFAKKWRVALPCHSPFFVDYLLAGPAVSEPSPTRPSSSAASCRILYFRILPAAFMGKLWTNLIYLGTLWRAMLALI